MMTGRPPVFNPAITTAYYHYSSYSPCKEGALWSWPTGVGMKTIPHFSLSLPMGGGRTTYTMHPITTNGSVSSSLRRLLLWGLDECCDLITNNKKITPPSPSPATTTTTTTTATTTYTTTTTSTIATTAATTTFYY